MRSTIQIPRNRLYCQLRAVQKRLRARCTGFAGESSSNRPERMWQPVLLVTIVWLITFFSGRPKNERDQSPHHSPRLSVEPPCLLSCPFEQIEQIPPSKGTWNHFSRARAARESLTCVRSAAAMRAAFNHRAGPCLHAVALGRQSSGHRLGCSSSDFSRVAIARTTVRWLRQMPMSGDFPRPRSPTGGCCENRSTRRKATCLCNDRRPMSYAPPRDTPRDRKISVSTAPPGPRAWLVKASYTLNIRIIKRPPPPGIWQGAPPSRRVIGRSRSSKP